MYLMIRKIGKDFFDRLELFYAIKFINLLVLFIS
jgi:hypothetical protein